MRIAWLYQQEIKMKYKKILITLFFILTLQVMPITVTGSIGIPCATSTTNQEQRVAEYKKTHPTATDDEAKKSSEMCNFNDIFVLINNGIKFFLGTILLPLMVILISYSGWLFMTSGANAEKRETAKKIFKNMAIGLAMILFAWTIVYLIFTAFGVDTKNGRAGLSDKTLDWNTNTANAVSATTAGSNSTNATPAVKSKYTANIVVNSTKPEASRATITISPKAEYKMAIRMQCKTLDGDVIVNGDTDEKTAIAKGSSVTTIVLALAEDTEYECSLENIDGEIVLTDPTDAQVKTAPGLSGSSKNFKITGSKFSNDSIIINYKNGSNLGSDIASMECLDKNTRNDLFGQISMIVDRSISNDARSVQYLLPYGFIDSLDKNINAECNLTFYEKDSVVKNKLNIINPKINGTFTALKNNPKYIATVFKVSSAVFKNTDTATAISNSASVSIVLDGSINIDPSMNMSCSSFGANHSFRARVAFDATARKNSSGTISSPIVLPVAWEGYGFRPNSFYNCEIIGKTVDNVSGYPTQTIKTVRTAFGIRTGNIPLIKKPESKLMYYVSIKQPRIVYANYPLLKAVDPVSSSPYISPSSFKQAVPDSIFMPVVNGEVVDNGRMNLSCSNVMGPAAGAVWTKTVAIGELPVATNGMTQVYRDNTSGSGNGVGFSIPITKNPQFGFMHSSGYACLAGFTVSGVPQVRSFFVTVPLNVDPKEIGQIVLVAENIGATASYANFTIVASPRVENNVSYTCNSSAGSYYNEAYWPPQALGTRMPVVIPVSNSVPGLKPAQTYSCKLNGVTFQKQKLEYQFNIKTP